MGKSERFAGGLIFAVERWSTAVDNRRRQSMAVDNRRLQLITVDGSRTSVDCFVILRHEPIAEEQK